MNVLKCESVIRGWPLLTVLSVETYGGHVSHCTPRMLSSTGMYTAITIYILSALAMSLLSSLRPAGLCSVLGSCFVAASLPLRYLCTEAQARPQQVSFIDHALSPRLGKIFQTDRPADHQPFRSQPVTRVTYSVSRAFGCGHQARNHHAQSNIRYLYVDDIPIDATPFDATTVPAAAGPRGNQGGAGGA